MSALTQDKFIVSSNNVCAYHVRRDKIVIYLRSSVPVYLDDVCILNQPSVFQDLAINCGSTRVKINALILISTSKNRVHSVRKVQNSQKCRAV